MSHSANKPTLGDAYKVFSDLSEVLLDLPGVSVGRRFGRACLKYGRHPFLVLDHPQLAFLTGLRSYRLIEQIPAAQLWNPFNQLRPKQTWLACPADQSEHVMTLTMAAFEHVSERARRSQITEEPLAD